MLRVNVQRHIHVLGFTLILLLFCIHVLKYYSHMINCDIKGFIRGYVTDEIFDINVEHIQHFFVRLMVTSQYYGNLTHTHERTRESGYFVAASMKTWRKLGLSVAPKESILKTMKYSLFSFLMVWVIIPNILLSYNINMVHAR